MSGIDRIGGNGKIARDTPSSGHELRDRGLDTQSHSAVQSRPKRNEKVDDVAKLYEKQFLREMVRAMRGTVSFGAAQPSMAENIYRGQLDEQYVESWGDNGGVGLSDLIYEQIMERYFQTAEGRAVKAKGDGIPLSDRDVARVFRMKSTAENGPFKNQVPLKVDLLPGGHGAPAKLQAPWDAEIVTRARLDGGKTALTLQHGPSLRSTLIFQGVASSDAQPGQRVEKGRTIGILSPEIRSFFWNLNKMGMDSSPDQSVSYFAPEKP